MVVHQAVNSLFEKGHFSICKLDEVVELVGARKDGHAYQMLRSLHCVDFAKMEPELRSRIPGLVNEVLRQQNNVVAATETALQGVSV